jgi:hypothetical protein
MNEVTPGGSLQCYTCGGWECAYVQQAGAALDPHSELPAVVDAASTK